jgi:hypothetical protein
MGWTKAPPHRFKKYLPTRWLFGAEGLGMISPFASKDSQVVPEPIGALGQGWGGGAYSFVTIEKSHY